MPAQPSASSSASCARFRSCAHARHAHARPVARAGSSGSVCCPGCYTEARRANGAAGHTCASPLHVAQRAGKNTEILDGHAGEYNMRAWPGVPLLCACLALAAAAGWARSAPACWKYAPHPHPATAPAAGPPDRSHRSPLSLFRTDAPQAVLLLRLRLLPLRDSCGFTVTGRGRGRDRGRGMCVGGGRGGAPPGVRACVRACVCVCVCEWVSLLPYTQSHPYY